MACEMNLIHTFEALMERDAFVILKNSNGDLPLHCGSRESTPSVVIRLIDKAP